MQLVLMQDDAAPDSMVEFNKRFESITGLTVDEFKHKAHKFFNQSDIHWILNGFELSISADDPFYALREQQTI